MCETKTVTLEKRIAQLFNELSNEDIVLALRWVDQVLALAERFLPPKYVLAALVLRTLLSGILQEVNESGEAA